MKKSVKRYIKKKVEKELDSHMEYLRASAMTENHVKPSVKIQFATLDGGYLIHPKAKYLKKSLQRGIVPTTKRRGSKT